MTINVNNLQKDIKEQSTVTALLEQLNVALKGIAVAINNEIITKDQWSETLLKEQDQVTIIQATQGG